MATDPKQQDAGADQHAKITELTAELRRVEAELREAKKSRGEWIARFHSSRPRNAFRRRLHLFLDLVQSRTPDRLRRKIRPAYLHCYRWFFPYGFREFESADLLTRDSSSRNDPGNREGARVDASIGSTGNSVVRNLGRDVLRAYPTYRPKVSVVLPVWNDAEFLSDSIGSVLDQSYSDVELLAVDDGSTVDLSPIFNRWSKDPRLRVIRRPHRGVGAALNAGFREASGEFWTWTSADNVMHPLMIETLVDFLLRHPCVEMAYGNMDLIDERGNPLSGSDVRLVNQRPHASHQLELPHSTEALGLEEDNFVGACFLYRRSAAELIGEYDEAPLGTEDYDFWLRLTLLGEIRHVDTEQCLYSYRVHQRSLTARYGQTQVANNIRSILARHAQREAFFRRPFKVSVFWETSSGASLGMVTALATALQQSGHQASLFCDTEPIVRRDELPFPMSQANSLDEVLREMSSACGDPHEKAILIGFLEHPEMLRGDEHSLTSTPLLHFVWVAPEFACDRLSASGESHTWLLCGSDDCREQLPAAWRRRASLLVANRRAWRNVSKLAIKARDNRYPLSEFPRLDKPLIVYAGPLDEELLDLNLVRATAAEHKGLNFLLLGEAAAKSESTSRRQINASNVFCVQGKPLEQWHIYMSRAALLLAPFKPAVARVEDIQDTLHCYLAAGKPILATEAAACAGFHDLPNSVIAAAESFCEMVPRALDVCPNLAIADQYLVRKSPTQTARNIVTTANRELFARLIHA